VKYCQTSMCNSQDIRFVVTLVDINHRCLCILLSDGASALTANRSTHGVYCLTALLTVLIFTLHHS
jgi:hypothetical protein